MEVKKKMEAYDIGDVIHHIWTQIQKRPYCGTPIHAMVVDEVQDFTQVRIKIIMCFYLTLYGSLSVRAYIFSLVCSIFLRSFALISGRDHMCTTVGQCHEFILHLCTDVHTHKNLFENFVWRFMV